MYSRRILSFVFWLFHILSIVVAQKLNSSEECRSEFSKGIHPICTTGPGYPNCISEGVIQLWESAVYCSAPYPIEIVVKFHNKIISDVSLNFPEFERTVEDISKPETYVYRIRVPFGFITRIFSDVKSFTIRSVNSSSLSTSFVNDYWVHRRNADIGKARGIKSVIPVTQELVTLPCPIYNNGSYPEGVHRIQTDSKKNTLLNLLIKLGPDVGWNNQDEYKKTGLESLFQLNNIPVDNKRLLWDPINGFRFNISNWPSKEYLGSYFCTAGTGSKFLLAYNFTLIDFEGTIGKPESQEIYITSITTIVNFTFECIATKEIRFESSFKNDTIYTGSTIVKIPDVPFRNTLHHLVYHLNFNIHGKDANNGMVHCIDIATQKQLRSWKLAVKDVRLEGTYGLDPPFVQFAFPLWIAPDGSDTKCHRFGIGSERTVKYLKCRNTMECEMIKFCMDQDSSCPNIVRLKQCDTYENCNNFRPPDNGIFQCASGTELTVTYFTGFDGLIYPDWTQAPLSAIIRLELKSEEGKLYSKGRLRISCKGHAMLTGGMIQWALQYRNNTWSHVQGLDVVIKTERLLDGIKSTLDMYLTTTDIVGITCMVPVWNSDKWINVTRELHVTEPSKPKIKMDGSNKSLKIGSKDQSISCEVFSDPESELTWRKLGSNVTNNFTISRKVNFASLQFPKFTSNDVGDYVCEAINIAGNDSKTFHVAIDEDTSSSWLYIVVGILLILLVIGSIVIVWIRRKLRIAKRADAETQIKESVDKFLNGYEDEDSNADKYPYNNEYEIPMENLTIDHTKVLGSGAFGIVYRGRMEGRSGTVAIKTLQKREYCDVEFFQALMSEFKLLVFIGEHPNVVELVGAITKNIHAGEFYIVSEECALGNLQKFLRSKRQDMSLTCECPVTYSNLTNDDGRTKQEKELLEYLMKWSYQIADAMEFISAKNVIHADLATRNILLTAGHDAKLTDFGLSRKLYNYVQYVKKKKEPLPWAWMSIEALRDLTFSSKSDVWSYGVVLWEMYSFGAIPYGGMNWDPGFVHKLKDGLRLPKPELATDSIYEVMQSCWNNEPVNRPDFSTLKSSLQSIKQSFDSGLSLSVTRTSVRPYINVHTLG